MTKHANDGGSRRQLNEDQNTVFVVLHRTVIDSLEIMQRMATRPYEYSWNLASPTYCPVSYTLSSVQLDLLHNPTDIFVGRASAFYAINTIVQ